MPHYPICVDFSNKTCVVIGGGLVAERKVVSFLDFGASVTVVAPALTPRLANLADEGKITCRVGSYFASELDTAYIVVAATDDREINRLISSDAQQRGIPVNVVDDPELCTFFVPATIRHRDVVISVSTAGKCPSLARRIKDTIATQIGAEYGELAEILGEVRDEIKTAYPDIEDRKQIYQRILDSDILPLLEQARHSEALAIIHECISAPA
ncbi:MAG: precorrin-2 dehydrogenase/sirohydrochlorin ferrochelatase family protein [Armatimonadota bacterium]